jgi:hypothetical protein
MIVIINYIHAMNARLSTMIIKPANNNYFFIYHLLMIYEKMRTIHNKIRLENITSFVDTVFAFAITFMTFNSNSRFA